MIKLEIMHSVVKIVLHVSKTFILFKNHYYQVKRKAGTLVPSLLSRKLNEFITPQVITTHAYKILKFFQKMFLHLVPIHRY